MIPVVGHLKVSPHKRILQIHGLVDFGPQGSCTTSGINVHQFRQKGFAAVNDPYITWLDDPTHKIKQKSS